MRLKHVYRFVEILSVRMTRNDFCFKKKAHENMIFILYFVIFDILLACSACAYNPDLLLYYRSNVFHLHADRFTALLGVWMRRKFFTKA